MKLLYGLDPVFHFSKGTVASIGNFDGVHLGHQALLRQLRAEADKQQLPLVLLIFEPQPSEYFHGRQAPARLSSLREKLQVLKACKVDYVYCLKFNEKLASMPPELFASQYFFSLLQVKYLLVGEDFRFGYRRAGDVSLLKKMGQATGCIVETFSDFLVKGSRASSTQVRELLFQNNLPRVFELLGRVFSLCGRVVKGDGRGRQWGFPTANLSLHRLSLPLTGVFCVKVRKASGALINGVANLGSRPTVDGTRISLEVHLLDFDEPLYGEMLQVLFLHKLREEIKFSSVDSLIKQIHNDVIAARTQFMTTEINNIEI